MRSVNLIIVFLRERFELKGCVLCVDEEVDRISAMVQTQTNKFVQSQIQDGLEPNDYQNLLTQAV